MKRFKLGIIQMNVVNDKMKNIEKAEEMVEKAFDSGAQIAVLPEMFNCPYDNKYFRDYGEREEDGTTIKSLSELSKNLGIYIVGGSIPEIDEEGNIYNTCFVFDTKGEIIGKHRKMHLFDIDVKGKIKFKESDTLTSGKDITIIDT